MAAASAPGGTGFTDRCETCFAPSAPTGGTLAVMGLGTPDDRVSADLPPAIQRDGVRMALRWYDVPDATKMADAEKSEKITINVGMVDLGQIDLLVSEGFFANRSDFIRTAIRRQLESRSDAVERTVARRELVLGVEHYSREALEQLRTAGRMVELRVLGLATIADDVSPELAVATIARVEVLGAFRAPQPVKAALASRTT
jgi:Arc/MetJ-type ribon-helix-helix transcriptional regulator